MMVEALALSVKHSNNFSCLACTTVPSPTPTRVVRRSLPTASSAFHRCRPRRRHHSVALAAAALVATVAIVAAAALFSRLKKCAGTPSGTEPCWELADGTMEVCARSILFRFSSSSDKPQRAPGFHERRDTSVFGIAKASQAKIDVQSDRTMKKQL